MKKFVVGSLALLLSVALMACGGAKKEESVAETESGKVQTESSKAEKESAKESEKTDANGQTEVQVFVAASLKNVMEDLGTQYEKENPSVKLVFQADSSGKLLSQIQEGYACDVFFSAAQKQMDTLEEEGKLVADGTVPVGRYTRKALVSLGILPEAEDLSKISTKEVSEALGGVEISEQSNVSKVLAAVVEGSSEVGTTYYSDTYGKEADIKILEKVPYDLTGNVIYPISQVVNDEASEAEVTEAKKFIDFVCSDAAKETFQKYYFDTNVE